MVCGLGFGLTEAIVRHTEARVRAAMGAVADRVDTVTVRLSDVNGPGHGGVDKQCRVVAWLRRSREVVAAAVERDLYAAIALAAGRAGLAVRRRVERRRSRRRGDRGPKPRWSPA